MALTRTSRGPATNTLGTGFTIRFNSASNFTAGTMAVICMRNYGSGGGLITDISDSLGNTWTQAGGGVEFWYTNMNGGTITTSTNINFTMDASAEYAGVAALYEIAGSVGTPTYSTSAFANGTGTSATITTSSIINGDVVIGFTNGDMSAITADSDTTNGTWSSAQTTTDTESVDSITIRISSQSKVVTATATQTYNTSWTGSIGYGIRWASFTEVIASSSLDPMGMSGFFGL